MSSERRARILGRLVVGRSGELETRRLCEVAVEVVGVSGAGVMLMSDDVPAGSICSSNSVSALIEDLQFELGEGPCVDAHRDGRPIVEPDLLNPTRPRWVAFAGPAISAGVRAVFGFPLRIGAVRLGALNMYSHDPGPMSDDQHAYALVMADITVESVLMMQANAPPGHLATELDSGGDFQYVVHQAAGMVAAQLETSLANALIRLRAHAFGNDRALTDVAGDVVARRLRFGDLT